MNLGENMNFMNLYSHRFNILYQHNFPSVFFPGTNTNGNNDMGKLVNIPRLTISLLLLCTNPLILTFHPKADEYNLH